MLKSKINYLKNFVTEERFEKFCQVLDRRTKYITVVLEDIFQEHNASAVIRNCEIFGVQNIYAIENKYSFEPNPEIFVGAANWVDVLKFNQNKNNSLDAINYLKQEGYRIVATSPHYSNNDLRNFDIEKGKFALFFGSERPGISNIIEENADEFISINMYGLTDSLNISVSVGIILHHLSWKLQNSCINWQLNKQEKEDLLYKWLCTSIKDSEKILKRYENGKLSK